VGFHVMLLMEGFLRIICVLKSEFSSYIGIQTSLFAEFVAAMKN
jgi:hypothetical protein